MTEILQSKDLYQKKNPIYHQKEHYNVLFSNYSDLFFEDLINTNPAL